MVSNQPKHPALDKANSQQQLNKVRYARLEVREVVLELADLNAKLAEHIRQQKLERVRQQLTPQL